MSFKKTCHNCKHLDYYEKESYEDSSEEGFFCNKREGKSKKEEEKLLLNLSLEKYRNRGKKCCDLRDDLDAHRY